MQVSFEVVPSERDPSKEYAITLVDGVAVSCGCADYTYRAQDKGECKHVRYVNEKNGVPSPVYETRDA